MPPTVWPEPAVVGPEAVFNTAEPLFAQKPTLGAFPWVRAARLRLREAK